MAISSRPAYIFDSGLQVSAQGSLTLNVETGVYTFSETQATIEQGEIGTVQVALVLPLATFSGGTPLVLFRRQDGYVSGLLTMSTATWVIRVDGVQAQYQVLYITMSAVGWTYTAGRHALQASYLYVNGSYDKIDLVYYTVDDGINNYEEVTADTYEEIATQFNTTYADLLDRMSYLEIFALNGLGYNETGSQTSIPFIKFYHASGLATISFDGTNFILNRNSVDEEVMTVLNNLADLANVIETNLATNDILIYNGTNYVNITKTAFLAALSTRVDNEINNIKNGTTIVKKSEQDASGNVITTTYETKANATTERAKKANLVGGNSFTGNQIVDGTIKAYGGDFYNMSVTSQLNKNNTKIVNLANGTNVGDAVNKGQINGLFKNVSYASATGILTFTQFDDTTVTVDLPLELIIESGYYDAVNNDIVLVLANASEIKIPAGDLLTDLDAVNVRYDNADSGLAATNTKAAIDELESDKIAKDYSSYTELTTLAEDDEIIVRDVANNLTKKAKMSALIGYYGNTREYGVREVVGQSSSTLERVLKVNGLMTIGSATNLVANVGIDDSVVTNNFDSITIFNRERVTISAGGVENVFVKVPKYYIKEEWTTESGTDYHYLWMCEHKLDVDYRLPLPFVTPEGTERDYAYIGAYEASLDTNGKLRSISGVFPKVSYSRANFRTAARKLDTNSTASKYQITDLAEYVDLVQIPMMIEFATKNMQSIMKGFDSGAYSDSHVATADGVASVGANTVIVANATATAFKVGQTIDVGTSRGGRQIAQDRIILSIDADTPGAGSSTITYDGAAVQALTGHFVYNVSWKTGTLDIAASSSAIFTDNLGKYPMMWRGIENPYGNIWKNVDGIKIVDNQTWICVDPSTYDDAASSDGEYAYPYQKLSYVNALVNGYAKTLGFDSRFPFAKLPSAIGADNATYYADYYYQNTGDRTAFVGGSWNFGTHDGPFCWFLMHALGSSYIYYGTRLSYRP